ncbi:MAG TPA: hypothetical protein VFU22_27555 [Roseiflexaceae bacterium]|nr:hypothetical protein [Roseiflexaceae bacterium]
MVSKRIMIVDYYGPTVDLLVEVLKGEGYTPIRSSRECLSVDCIIDARADLLILELGLGYPSTMLQLLRDLRRHPSTLVLPVIVDSTDDLLLAQLDEELRELGCVSVAKPFDIDILLSLVDAGLALGCEQSQRQPC